MTIAIVPGAIYGKLTVKAPARLMPGEWICSCSCGTLRSYTEFDIECVSHCGCKLPQAQSKHYLVNGASITAYDIERIYGVKHQTFYARIKAGWDPVVAATHPVQPHTPKTRKPPKPRLTAVYKGETLTMQQLFKHSQVSYNLMYYRIRTGQSAEDAIKPIQRPVNTKYLFQGELRSMTEIVALTGVNYNTLQYRLAANVPIEQAAVPTRNPRRTNADILRAKRAHNDKN